MEIILESYIEIEKSLKSNIIPETIFLDSVIEQEIRLKSGV